jgi:ribosomal protein S18 acetylase RimI-like enzyme
MVDIRPASDADLEAAVAIIAEDAGGSPDEWRGRFVEVLSDPDRHFLVAVVDGRVVGFGHTRHVGRIDGDGAARPPSGWYLSGLTVAPQHRRRRVGTRLTQERLDLLEPLTPTVYYAAERDNAATLALHRALGFVDAGEVMLPGHPNAMLLQRLDFAAVPE